MNNGNLLTSLLGITSANPAVTKTTATKARAESAEKFQQALEQVRPEIAARKPVARKESPAAEPSARPAPKPIAQRETQKADTTSKEPQNTNTTVNQTADSSSTSVYTDEQATGNQNEGQSADAQSQTLAGEDQNLELQDQTESLLLADPALVAASESEELLGLPKQLLGTTHSPSGVLGDATNSDLAKEDDIDPSLVLDEAVVLDPSFLVAQSPVAPLGEEVLADTESDAPSTLMAANPAVLGKVASALNITDASTDADSVTGVLAGKLVDGLANNAAAEADVTSETKVATEAGTDTGENPDFLMLNSKTALNKLAETTMTAATLDKAASATEVVKPAAVSAAVETLTRLTEAQSPAARAFVVQTGVPVTVGSPQWSQAVGDKVLWLAAQNVSAAEIRLDPPELGPIQVKVSVNQDQASVTFTSPHPAVREALDQQLNRLREMFSEQGLNLVNVDVSDKSFAQHEREKQESAGNQAGGVADEEELAPVALSQAVSMRLVDHYA